MDRQTLTICYFGSYDPGYSRNEILLKGLQQVGVKVIKCNSRQFGLRKYLDLYHQHRELKGAYDALIVGYSGYDGPRLMILAKLLTRKKIIFDAFFSVYDTFVYDRQLAWPKSAKALVCWLVEWLAYRLADMVVYDTKAHIDYVSKLFKIGSRKFHRIFIGANLDKFYPLVNTHLTDYTIVEFHGGYIPLQGVDYIVRAAKLLENDDFLFKIIGSGQTYAMVRTLADKLKIDNVEFLPPALPEEINRQIAAAHICLGIFGRTAKASNVIPNKVFEALAAGCPTITGDSTAARELLTDGENILLCKMADPRDLAAKILELKNDQELRQRITAGGLKLTKERLTAKILGGELKELIVEML